MNPSTLAETQTAADGPTPLDPRETTDTRETALAPCETDPKPYGFRHASWRHYRTLIYRALKYLRKCGTVPPARLERFMECGRRAWILRHRQHPDRYKIVLDCCHDRFCIPCGRARSAVVADNLRRKLADHPHRLLTLTLRHCDAPLADQIDRLFRHFKRLRHRSLWKERVQGGAALLEIGFNFQTNRWHPHLHVILDGKFFPHAALKSMWLDVTGDSSIIDIRLIRTIPELVSYVTKYVTKPLSAELTRHGATLLTAILALTGRKTLFTFGTWSRWHLLDPHDSRDWELYSHVEALPFGLPDAQTLNDQLLALYEVWAHHGGDAEFTIRDPPHDDGYASRDA